MTRETRSTAAERCVFHVSKRGEKHTRTICCQPDALMALQLARHALLLSTLSSRDDNLIVMIHKQTYGFTATSTTAPMNHFSSRRKMLQSRNLLHEQLMYKTKWGENGRKEDRGRCAARALQKGAVCLLRCISCNNHLTLVSIV